MVLLLYLFVNFAVAKAVTDTQFVMPHLRSAAALDSRRARAIERGFLSPTPKGYTHVSIPSTIASRVRRVAASMEVHRRHNCLSGSPAHYAKLATLAVRGQIGELSFKDAMATHRERDKAIHAWGSSGMKWADAIEDDSPEMCADPPVPPATPSAQVQERDFAQDSPFQSCPTSPPSMCGVSGVQPSVSLKLEHILDKLGNFIDDLSSALFATSELTPPLSPQLIGVPPPPPHAPPDLHFPTIGAAPMYFPVVPGLPPSPAAETLEDAPLQVSEVIAEYWEDLAPPFADHSFDTHISDPPKDLPDRSTSCSRPPPPQSVREVRELGHLIWTLPCTGTPKPDYAEQHHLSCIPNASDCSSLSRRGKFVKKSRSGRFASSTSLGTEIVKCHSSSTPHRKCSRHPAGPSDDCSECSRCLAESLASVQWE